MEDTLRVGSTDDVNKKAFGLNPCFNGRYSQRFQNLAALQDIES